MGPVNRGVGRAGLRRSGGGGRGGGAQRREGRAPGGDLVQQRVQVGGVVVARLEDGVVLEIGQQRQRDLLAHVGHLQFRADQPQVLGGPGAARQAVGDEPGRLVVPLGVQEVEGVLEHSGGGVVVLGSDHDEPVERGDRGRPLPGVLVLVLAQRRRQRLIEVRQRVVAQVNQLELGIAAARCHVIDPRGDLLAVAVGADAAEDDADPDHRRFSCSSSGAPNLSLPGSSSGTTTRPPGM